MKKNKKTLSWEIEGEVSPLQLGRFRYFFNQPYGFFSGTHLSLEEVVKKIESDEFNGKNVLTVELWSKLILPNMKIEYCLDYNSKTGKSDFDDNMTNESLDKFSSRLIYDFPAWALIRHENGNIYVGVKGKDEKGIDSIGALDHKKYLQTKKIGFARGLKMPLKIYEKRSDWVHPSKYETICDYLYTMDIEKKTGLCIHFHPGTSLVKNGRIWNAGEEVKPMVMSHPAVIISGGDGRICYMDNLADNNCSEYGAVILGEYALIKKEENRESFTFREITS